MVGMVRLVLKFDILNFACEITWRAIPNWWAKRSHESCVIGGAITSAWSKPDALTIANEVIDFPAPVRWYRQTRRLFPLSGSWDWIISMAWTWCGVKAKPAR